MDDLRTGSYADSMDLSKTFDQDEIFDKVPHRCRNVSQDAVHLRVGTKCPHCGEVVKKP